MNKQEPKKEYNIQKIIQDVNDFPHYLIEEGLASMHERVQNVINFKRLDSKDKSKSSSYAIGIVESLHLSTEEDYNKLRKHDLTTKFQIMTNLQIMEEKIVEIESRDGDDQDER